MKEKFLFFVESGKLLSIAVAKNLIDFFPSFSFDVENSVRHNTMVCEIFFKIYISEINIFRSYNGQPNSNIVG